MLIDSTSANIFLSKYKTVMAFLNKGALPECLEDYGKIRPLIFKNIKIIEAKLKDDIGINFIASLKLAKFGTFIYLKKYRSGYILKEMDKNKYYQVKGLNSPLEEIIYEYSIIETAIIPFENKLICDGLIISQNMLIGKNMMQEIHEGYLQAKKAGELITNA